MPARPDVVARKLLDIKDAVSRLRSWSPMPVERLHDDVMLSWAVEHGFCIAIGALFDAGTHILAAHFEESPDEDREIPSRLVSCGVISAETAKRLESLAGLRSVLVHDRATVDVARVHAGVGRLDDLESFVADVEGWLSRELRT